MAPNLLHEIQMESVNSGGDLAGLLRKCRILAQRLGNEDLKTWVQCELDGYPTDDTVPDYRIHRNGLLHGKYLGYAGSSVSNVHIPHTSIHEDYRELMRTTQFRDGVATLQSFIQNNKDQTLRFSMAPELINFVSWENDGNSYELAHITKLVPINVLEGVLSTIRNKILSFTLELEEFALTTGDPLKNMKEEHAKDIQHVFNTQITGNVSNLNQGGDHVTQNAMIQPGDLDAVSKKLSEMGLSSEEIIEFQESLKETPNKEEAWGDRLLASFGKTIKKAGEGTLKVSATIATTILTEMIEQYYGLK